MKRIRIKTIAAAALAPIFCGCTSNFEDYNTNPYQPHDLNPPMLYTTMITSGVNVQQNDNQMIDQKGTDEDVIRAEVRRAMDTYVGKGRYIPYYIPTNKETFGIYIDEVTKYGKDIFHK